MRLRLVVVLRLAILVVLATLVVTLLRHTRNTPAVARAGAADKLLYQDAADGVVVSNNEIDSDDGGARRTDADKARPALARGDVVERRDQRHSRLDVSTTTPLPEKEDLTIGEGLAVTVEGVIDIRDCDALLRTPNVDAVDVQNCVKEFNRGHGGNINFDRFPLREPVTGVVLVIPIYDRVDHLREVLRSWEANVGINETTIIISHDGFIEEVHELVRSLRFARIKQIYHPYSAFFNPSALWATRLHRFSRLKHHFWWIINFVWRHTFEPNFMPPQRNVFINEDDLMVGSDAYAAAKALFQLRHDRVIDPSSNIFCVNLALHPTSRDASSPHYDKYNDADLYRVGVSSFQALGWGLSLDMAERLIAAGESFCSINDYNWDWTFTHMINSGVLPSRCLNLFWPRAGFHIGSCGTHIKSANCEPAAVSAERMRQGVLARLDESLRKHRAAVSWNDLSSLKMPAISDQSSDHVGGQPIARGRSALNEGWTRGRIWHDDMEPGDPRRDSKDVFYWDTDDHRQHCLQVASEVM